ncbi:hypothetical protein BH24CHL6_BH24CHL6_12700 [soil metagenome]
MRRSTLHPRKGQSGQALVILTLSVAALLAMTGLIVDGGSAMAGQRSTQNASDAAALAGSTVMVENMSGAVRTNADVYAAISAAFAANDTDFDNAEYVDYNNNVVGTVGQSGSIPGGAAGVRAHGARNIPTHLSGIVGIPSMDVAAQATALAGATTGVCSAVEGCAISPVTFSIPIRVCDGTNRSLILGEHWPLTDLATAESGNAAAMSIVPLCTNGPGGVGWLDLAELGCPGTTLESWISNPCNVSLDLPTWLKTKSGNMNNVESALNKAYKGKVMLIPLFDSTCKTPPDSGQPQDCTDPGQGSNLWYHIPKFAAFYLYEAYIQGKDGPACNSAPGLPKGGGNGATSCLKGWFINFITVGPVGPPQPCVTTEGCVDTVFSVQLVR